MFPNLPQTHPIPWNITASRRGQRRVQRDLRPAQRAPREVPQQRHAAAPAQRRQRGVEADDLTEAHGMIMAWDGLIIVTYSDYMWL